MSDYLDCIPCILRQSLDATRFATSNGEIQERILRETLEAIGRLDWRQPPAASAQRLHRRIRELTGLDDPYREVKQQQNDAAIEFIDRLRSEIRQSPISLELAVRLAIAGNIIDLAVKTGLEACEIHENITDAFQAFVQIHRQPGENREGYGLGLPLCRRIVEALGGTLELTSIEGEGTTAMIRLPVCE